MFLEQAEVKHQRHCLKFNDCGRQVHIRGMCAPFTSAFAGSFRALLLIPTILFPEQSRKIKAFAILGHPAYDLLELMP